MKKTLLKELRNQKGKLQESRDELHTSCDELKARYLTGPLIPTAPAPEPPELSFPNAFKRKPFILPNSPFRRLATRKPSRP